MAKERVLIVDDDAIIVDSLKEFLSLEGYEADGADDFDSALSALEKRPYQLIISDVNMPDGDGFELLRVVKQRYPEVVVIIITGYGTIESAVEAIKLGAYDYLTKPIIDDEIRLVVKRALQQQSLIRENQNLRQQLDLRFGLDNIIGHDYKMLRVFDLVEAVAPSNSTVLLTGESGTGKSLIARVIHHRSSRADKPFVEVSCGALPETLLESELFGHTKGSFTGAVADKKGRFLAADGGTIFLDEISSASPGMQVKLLRVLQERQFEAVGSNQTLTVDVRVVLATNRELKAEVAADRFREDLYYRINVVAIELPPLRERLGDIALLAEHFIRKYGTQGGKQITAISDWCLKALQRYGWPGNVRELENVVERAVVLSKGPTIEMEDLPPSILEQDESAPQTTARPLTSLKEALEVPERAVIRQALIACNWNRQLTADVMKINRTTLYKKIRYYGLDKEGA
ncbi:MAG: sigma-54 dependent transcriptional regulator [Phycisphaerae bacterium]|nr:sigma-54 dependent transcriptional regulator [Phycisphaerae bacterium]